MTSSPVASVTKEWQLNELLRWDLFRRIEAVMVFKKCENTVSIFSQMTISYIAIMT